MNIVGAKVKGFDRRKNPITGIVKELNQNRIVIQFSDYISKYPYPDCFDTYLKFEDASLQADVEVQISDKRKKAEMEKRKAEYEKAAKIVAAQETKPRVSAKKEVKRNSNAQTYFVFQGGTYNDEMKGGLIWAPKGTSDGKSKH